MRYFLFSTLILLLVACKPKQELPVIPEEIPSEYEAGKLRIPRPMQTIAFGSCNNQRKEQTYWDYIGQNSPNLWIWLGDNIYADTEDMVKMSKMYKKQKFNPNYMAFKKSYPVIGIWDDHDFGVNDGDKSYAQKKESKRLMLNFLGVHPEDPARKREGAYQSYLMGPDEQLIKVILLDARYFRDPLEPNPDRMPRYLPNEEGDLLGEDQWKWLEEELTNSEAKIHLIGSGIQFIPEEHGFEKWANFPKARQRFFDLLAKTKPAHTILLSGDRHLAEISKMEVAGLDYPVYEITSSGLTHSYKDADEPNKYRVSDLIGLRNFGLLKVDWTTTPPTVTAEVRGIENALLARKPLDWTTND